MSKDIAIEANALTKTYPPDVRALDGLSLAVPAGTIFGLLGPNGAGKSTTVRILTTLSRPDSGSARVAGVDVLPIRSRVRHAIGVVGQKHGARPRGDRAREPHAPGRVLRDHRRDLRGRVAERSSASASPTPPTGRRRPTRAACSGGSTSRMGLIHRPQVLFLDEPTTGLDPEARADMWHEIERLAREERMTILLTTHYLEEADRLASQLAIVDRGRIVAEGSPDELKAELRRRPHPGRARRRPRRRGARVRSARVGGVGDVALDGRTLHARADDGARGDPRRAGRARAQGVRGRLGDRSRGRRSTTSTCATPGAPFARRRHEEVAA